MNLAEPSLVLMRRHALRMALLFVSSAGAAFAISTAARVFLPYEALRRFTPEEQFLAWEGVLWMLGLGLVFLGGAAAMGTLQWIRWGIPDWDEYRAHIRRRDEPRPSLVPWWILSTGAVLLVIALQARAQLPG